MMHCTKNRCIPTPALLSAVPEPDPALSATIERVILQGDVPSPANPPNGCNFSTRCPRVMDICKKIDPDFRELMPGRHVACHLYNEDNNEIAGQTAATKERRASNKETNNEI